MHIVLKNFNSLQIKIDWKLQCPLPNEKIHEEGDIKLGNNNKLWIIKNKKWNEIKEKHIVLQFKQIWIKKIFKYNFIGKCSKIPIFILWLKYKSHDIVNNDWKHDVWFYCVESLWENLKKSLL